MSQERNKEKQLPFVLALMAVIVLPVLLVLKSFWKGYKHYKALCFVGPVLTKDQLKTIKTEVAKRKRTEAGLLKIREITVKRETPAPVKLSRAELRYRKSRVSNMFMVH